MSNEISKYISSKKINLKMFLRIMFRVSGSFNYSGNLNRAHAAFLITSSLKGIQYFTSAKLLWIELHVNLHL
jgi:hypothetical protein